MVASKAVSAFVSLFTVNTHDPYLSQLIWTDNGSEPDVSTGKKLNPQGQGTSLVSLEPGFLPVCSLKHIYMSGHW